MTKAKEMASLLMVNSANSGWQIIIAKKNEYNEKEERKIEILGQ